MKNKKIEFKFGYIITTAVVIIMIFAIAKCGSSEPELFEDKTLLLPLSKTWSYKVENEAYQMLQLKEISETTTSLKFSIDSRELVKDSTGKLRNIKAFTTYTLNKETGKGKGITTSISWTGAKKNILVTESIGLLSFSKEEVKFQYISDYVDSNFTAHVKNGTFVLKAH